MSSLAATVCFIACHGGPADHFATFVEQLPKDSCTITICASGPALKKFQERGIAVHVPFSIDTLSAEDENLVAEKIARTCSVAQVVITDVGHSFDIKIQKSLSQQAAHVRRFAYYDNPEPYVPGGYSSIAAQVMLLANGILFANSNLDVAPIFQEPGKEVCLEGRERIGIGYYPVHQSEKIARQRETDHVSIRKRIFLGFNVTDTEQKVLVYFGGNNQEYFAKAFPAFLSLLEEGLELSDFSNLVIILQQHPGAKNQNLDAGMVQDWAEKHKDSPRAPTIIISNFSSDEAQIVADAALYFQTSMGPQFVLEGIPTAQIGHEPFQDILVRNRLAPSVTTVGQLTAVIDGLSHQHESAPREVIFEGLGIKAHWLELIQKVLYQSTK